MIEELATLSADPTRTPEKADRIRTLRAVLRNAEASEKPDDGLVEPGMLVTVLFDNDAQPTTFLLGSRDLITTDPSIPVDVYSPTSPLGQALHGTNAGDTVHFTAPSGRQVTVRIITAKPFKLGSKRA